MDRDVQINTFNRIAQVSRETIRSLEKFENLLIKANKSLNLIGKSTVNEIWNRHILDCFQAIDLIEENNKSLIDIGSGAGFPGLILAIAATDKKIPIKINLIEKSLKKTKFLSEIISKLNLNVEVSCKNILEDKKKLEAEIFTTRAFKPLPLTLKLIHSQARNWKKIIIFLGKSGKSELLQASKNWDMEYKQRVSITSDDSVVISINKLKKK